MHFTWNIDLLLKSWPDDTLAEMAFLWTTGTRICKGWLRLGSTMRAEAKMAREGNIHRQCLAADLSLSVNLNTHTLRRCRRDATHHYHTVVGGPLTLHAMVSSSLAAHEAHCTDGDGISVHNQDKDATGWCGGMRAEATMARR